MTLTLRPGRPEDAQACGTICYNAFATISTAHGFAPDFPAPEAALGLMQWLLGGSDGYSVIAEADSRVIGSNFLWFLTSEPVIAGVGPITVDPAVQNASTGRRLMEDVLARARERRCAGVRLVQAAYHNRSLSLYTKLGFDVREPLSCIQGPPPRDAMPRRYAVRPAVEADLLACDDLCRHVHGHDRSPELIGAIRKGTATVAVLDGRITGYATSIGFFGHAVGRTNDDLKALIAAAPQIGGSGLLLPSRNSELFRWCLANGLRVTQPLTLMSMGLYNEPKGAFLPSILY